MSSERWRLASCVLSLTVGLSALPVLHARAADPLRLVLRLASDADRALLPRLQGQLSDVEAQLIAVETSPLEAALIEQLDVARTLAAQHNAEVVVWCADGFLQIAQPRADRILTRPLAGSTAAFSSSELETAALLVRSALVALARHAEIGVPTREVVSATSVGSEAAALNAADARVKPEASVAAAESDKTPPIAAAAALHAPTLEVSAGSLSESRVPAAQLQAARVAADPQPPPKAARLASIAAAAHVESVDSADPSASSEPSFASAAPRARLSLGAQLALDGQSRAGQRGLYARAGLSMGGWALSVYGAVSLPSNIDDAYFDLSVARQAVGIAIERQLQLADSWSLAWGAHAGALLLRRASRAKSVAAISFPASLTAAFAFGPELALSWLRGRFGVALRVGLDFLPDAPRFESAGLSPQRTRVAHPLWTFQPRIALGWETALP